MFLLSLLLIILTIVALIDVVGQPDPDLQRERRRARAALVEA